MNTQKNGFYVLLQIIIHFLEDCINSYQQHLHWYEIYEDKSFVGTTALVAMFKSIG